MFCNHQNTLKTGDVTLGQHKKDHPQANMTDHTSPNLSAVVSKVNLTTNNKDWWVDTRATRHICSEKLLFSDY